MLDSRGLKQEPADALLYQSPIPHRSLNNRTATTFEGRLIHPIGWRRKGRRPTGASAPRENIMPEMKDGCVKPARGPLMAAPGSAAPSAGTGTSQEVTKMTVRVGMEAIDFEANAFVRGEGFQPIKLSDYKGKWIVLCFYPGDFTFV
jgi:hypothetical protein